MTRPAKRLALVSPPASAPVERRSSVTDPVSNFPGDQAAIGSAFPELVTVPECAAITRTSPAFIRKQERLGTIVGCRLGRRLLIFRESLLAFVERGRGGGQ